MVVVTVVEVWNAVAVVALSAIAYQLITRVLWEGLWEPLRLRRIMAKQGVKAAPIRFLVGQVRELVAYGDSFPEVVPVESYAALSPTVTPQFAFFFPQFPGEKWFLYWRGTAARLVVRDPEIAKEVFVNNFTSLKRSTSTEWFYDKIFGKGLSLLVGEKWVTERRTIKPFFHQDVLKGMVEAMVEGTATGIHKWEEIVAKAGGSAEIDVEPDVHKISGRVLSLTAFGGDFETGEQIYDLQMEMIKKLNQMVRDVKFWLIPFYRKIPTKLYRHIDQMGSKIDTLVRGVMNARLEAVRNGETGSHGDDLLGLMLTAATEGWEEESLEFNQASVLNNGKLFYFAGQDTVANTVVFAMLMLALHPAWQDRARKEVREVLGDVDENFNASVLSRLNVVGMILNETLRTFGPAPMIARAASKDIQLKSLFIPKGVTIEFAVGAVHQAKEYWGDDVAVWNPERFANGIARACSHPQAFSPFGLGPRTCIANNFAMMEMKVIMARVLTRFELAPSPKYKHHPTLLQTIKPKYGLPLILKAL